MRSSLLGGGGLRWDNVPPTAKYADDPKDGGNLQNQEGFDGFLPNQSGIGMFN